ncbi:hypothetical protein ES703_111136 [subsurface metagenome]
MEEVNRYVKEEKKKTGTGKKESKTKRKGKDILILYAALKSLCLS